MTKSSMYLWLGAILVSGAALASTTAARPTSTTATKTSAAKPATLKDWHRSGSITNLDAAKKTLTVKSRRESVTFLTDSATRYTRSGKPASWSDLEKGEKVAVVYRSVHRVRTALRVAISG